MILLSLLLQAAAPAVSAQSTTLQGTPACPNPDSLPAAAAAKRCVGMVAAGEARWADAAQAFADAAGAAGPGKTAALWAQAGNAWLAAGEPAKAATALDSALIAGVGQPGFDRGELMLDRARAAVAAGDLPGARRVLDQALALVPTDPLAWLLSATLARRSAEPPRAATDIAKALQLAPDDAAVQLEAGNIAALAGDEAGAKARWAEAARLQPTGPSGAAAKAALAQFDLPVRPSGRQPN